MAFNPFSWFRPITEQDVLNFIAKVKADIAVVEAEVTKAIKWFNSHAGEIASTIQMVERAVVSSGMALSPQALVAIAAANEAVAALNAYAKAVNDGKPTVDAAVQGYAAFKNAQAASASAAAAVAAQPAQPKA